MLTCEAMVGVCMVETCKGLVVRISDGVPSDSPL